MSADGKMVFHLGYEPSLGGITGGRDPGVGRRDGEEFRRLPGGRVGTATLTQSMAFTPDGKSLAVSQTTGIEIGGHVVTGPWDCNIEFWSLADRKKVREDPEAVARGTQIAISPDGKVIAELSSSFKKVDHPGEGFEMTGHYRACGTWRRAQRSRHSIQTGSGPR